MVNLSNPDQAKKSSSLNALALAAAAGDQDAFSRLVKEFQPAIRSIAESFPLPQEEKDDLCQEGLIGLYKAVLLFNPELSSFATFARLCIRSGIADGVKKFHRGDLSLFLEEDAEIVSDEKNDPQRILLGKEELSEVLHKIDQILSPLERRVLALHLMGKEGEQIGKRVGISLKSVNNALFRCRKKLSELR